MKTKPLGYRGRFCHGNRNLGRGALVRLARHREVSHLETRLRCPLCGSRDVVLITALPN